MGLTNLFSNLLSNARSNQRSLHPNHTPHHSTDQDRAPKTPSSVNPPRRRRRQPAYAQQSPPIVKDDWEQDSEPAWLFDDHPVFETPQNHLPSPHSRRAARRAARRSRRALEDPVSASSAAFPPAARKIRPSLDHDIPNWLTRDGPLKSHQHSRDPQPSSRPGRRPFREGPSSSSSPRDRHNPSSSPSRRDDRGGPPSRKLASWRRRSGRVSSNLERAPPSEHNRYPTQSRSTSHSTSQSTSHSNHSAPSAFPEYSPPPYARTPHAASPQYMDYEAPTSDSPPSLRRVLAGARAAAAGAAGGRRRNPLSSRDPLPYPSIDDVRIPDEKKAYPRHARKRAAYPPQGRPSGIRELSYASDGVAMHSGRNASAPRVPRRRGGRIMSNIDQFIRRDAPEEPRSYGRRRRHHSALNDANMPVPVSVSSSQPVSLVNEAFLDPTLDPEYANQPLASAQPHPLLATPQDLKPVVGTGTSPPETAPENLIIPIVSGIGDEPVQNLTIPPPLVTPPPLATPLPLVTPPPLAPPPLAPPPLAPPPILADPVPPGAGDKARRTLSHDKPPRVPSPPYRQHSGQRKEPDMTPRKDLEHLVTIAQKLAAAEKEPQQRVSADAVYPPRLREPLPHAFARCQSNPLPPTQTTPIGLKRRHRPPPILTPANGVPGFACGAGADSSGFSRFSAPQVNRRVYKEKGMASNMGRKPVELPRAKGMVGSDVSSVGGVTESDLGTGIVPLEESTRGLTNAEIDEGILEPKAYAKSDIWSADYNRASETLGAAHLKFSAKLSDKDPDYLFEEASQSSFGDNESLSKIAARNGIVLMEDRSLAPPDVLEDNFVFGDDESFTDGGFIVSSNGRLDLPEKVTRKMSDGVAVEGVPSSSHNVIFVRDLSEFRKRYTFKDQGSYQGKPTLGRGAAGKVYLAIHQPSRLKIAVKEINIFDPNKRHQLKEELRTLIGHQSRFLVRSYGAFYGGNGTVHVALEFMDRGSLSDIVMQLGAIPEPVIRKIAEHCLRGLSFLHANHIIHRDVKTGNILLSRKLCRAKLSDFGLARDLTGRKKNKDGSYGSSGEGLSVTRTFVGTLLYMSPERLKGNEYTYASDVWGVGIATLECVLGRCPFEKPKSYFDILEWVKYAPRDMIQEANVSAEMCDFVTRATEVDAKLRPSAKELLEHEWIKQGQDNANVLRDWLDSLPRLQCQNVEIGSGLESAAKKKKRRREQKALAKRRAKALES